MNKKILFFISLAAQTLLFSACDNGSSSGPNMHNNTPPPSNIINWTEVPRSCTSLLDRDTVFIDIAFEKWTWSEADVFNGDTIHTTHTFTGLDESDFNFFCENEKIEEISSSIEGITTTNVICIANMIQEEAIINPAIINYPSPAEYASTMYNICQMLLREEITLKDFIFDEE